MRVGHEELEDAAVAENDATALVDEFKDVVADDRAQGAGGHAAGLEQMEDVARPDAALEELFDHFEVYILVELTPTQKRGATCNSSGACSTRSSAGPTKHIYI